MRVSHLSKKSALQGRDVLAVVGRQVIGRMLVGTDVAPEMMMRVDVAYR
jgi:hypothetical protein